MIDTISIIDTGIIYLFLNYQAPGTHFRFSSPHALCPFLFWLSDEDISSLAKPLFYLFNPPGTPLPRPRPLPPRPHHFAAKSHQLDLDPPIPPAQSHNNHNNNAYGEGASPSSPAWGATNGFETVNGSSGGGGPGVAGGPRGGSNGWGTAGGWSQRGGGGPAADGGGGGAWAGAGSMSHGPGATILDEALAALFGGEAVAGVKGRLNMEVGAFSVL